MNILSKKNTLSCIGLILLLVAFLLLSACAKTNSVNNSKYIEDLRGEKFSLDQPINKVVSTHNPTLNHLIILGNGTSKHISGFGRKDMYSNLYSKILSDWESIECVGSDVSPVNKETIIKMDPDLIILPQFDWEIKEKDYEGLNKRTFVCFPENESIDSVIDSLELLAKILNEENRAAEVKEKYYEIINEIKNISNKIENKPNVLFLGPRIYSVASANMIQNQIIESAGAVSSAKKIQDTSHFSNVEPEVIINMNPEYIFIPSYSEYNCEDIYSDPKLSNIKAIKDKKVFKFPSNLDPWDTPTCSAALGIAWAAYKIHPDLYPKEKLIQATIQFYELMYNHKFVENDFDLN